MAAAAKAKEKVSQLPGKTGQMASRPAGWTYIHIRGGTEGRGCGRGRGRGRGRSARFIMIAIRACTADRIYFNQSLLSDHFHHQQQHHHHVYCCQVSPLRLSRQGQ
ncbi:hypothetical protein BO70DRAFT_358532 [Aspergillus heteromorphus CBS 117.55]|uniref:Uncharacterized protein n=1 Tax=Aspergillus heteromorphus CBS 117.55 TaxID=1448321 RepID=A0A317X0P4_9EURO|nr:uncharacterized protein BO70DRAFT_358532 [Aspergillus heteromorphus CBS 117.55]PWY91097.1 hypothetical protein BO70DRAFT_358532 [Aspergillus heteromorphus CBS 117.55]